MEKSNEEKKLEIEGFEPSIFFFNKLVSQAASNIKEKLKITQDQNDKEELEKAEKKVKPINAPCQKAGLYAIWRGVDYREAEEIFYVSTDSGKGPNVIALINLVFTHAGDDEKNLLFRYTGGLKKGKPSGVHSRLLKEYFTDKVNSYIVRGKWIPKVKERCEKFNVLGTSFNQREEKDIFGLWQTISLSDNNSDGGEFLKIGTDDESMQKFIERMSEKDKLSSKILVYGNQGLGKTSLLKFFAMKCVNGTFMGDYVPIFLSMPRVYERSHFHVDSNNLLEYIESWIKSKSEVTSMELRNVLDQGKVLFLLDGIDFNSQTLQKTTAFIREFKSNSFILTTNQPINNLKSKSTPDLLTNLVNEHDFKVFEMMGFKVNPESKQSFVQNWFKKHSIKKNDIKNDIEFLNEEEKLSLADSLIERVNSSSFDSPLDNFSSSPLLLQFLCLASLNRTNAETNLLILYQDALFTLIIDVEVDEVSKEGIFDPKDDIYRELNLFKRVELLSYIGFQMFKDNHIYAPLSKLGEYIYDYFQDQNIQTSILEFEKKGEAIIRSIEMQDGLLVNRMWGEYSFSHPTIQEFFASYYISQNPSKWEVWQDSCPNDMRWEKIFNQAEKILEINLNRFKKLRSK